MLSPWDNWTAEIRVCLFMPEMIRRSYHCNAPVQDITAFCIKKCCRYLHLNFQFST